MLDAAVGKVLHEELDLHLLLEGADGHRPLVVGARDDDDLVPGGLELFVNESLKFSILKNGQSRYAAKQRPSFPETEKDILRAPRKKS